MRFKLDEDTPLRLAALLREREHDADTVQDEGLTGLPDAQIAGAAAGDGRILISLDLGFSDIRSYPPGSHPGIIVIRPEQAASPSSTQRESASGASPGAEPPRR